MKTPTLLGIVLLAIVYPCRGASFYPVRLDDPKAVYLTADQFPVHGDGKADDSAAIQAAIDKVPDADGGGIVFVPEGRYRITRTIYVWSGIRVIGYGATRPVFVLADNTPGFQQGMGDMFFYAGGRPRAGRGAPGDAPPGGAAPGGRGGRGFAGGGFRPNTPPGTVPPTSMGDAGAGTFYSAMSNVDFEIGNGNPAAVGIRFHAAQHAYLAHIDFHIGSGLAALNDIGNEAEDLRFYGGRYGILTRKPSPAWQFTLLDSTFDGQREAAIRENEAGLTLVHASFRNVPTAIAIDERYWDELWVKDALLENISGPAFLIGRENSRMTEINMENIVCRHAPVFARFRESGRQVAGTGETYQVKVFSHGLTLPGPGAAGEIKTIFEAVPMNGIPPATPSVIPAPPAGTWVNLRSLGAKGDGVTDDTAVLKKAIAEHRVLYLPSGHYVVSDTILLRSDTVLIGLHPNQTQIDLLDSTPGFEGPGTPRPLVEAPQGGTNIVTGIGIYPGGINARAAGMIWMAGKDSLVDDVRFLGGHGTNGPDGRRVNPYNNNSTSDPDTHRRWDAQYPSLWVTNGGGGTFANIWTPDTFAQAGIYISNTTTPGRVYQLSSEHHVRNEIKLDQVSNWELDALQTEEESGEGPLALSLAIDRSSNITIANYHGYRVVRSQYPFPYAIRISHSSDIRFRNVHVDSNSSMAQCDASGECRQYVRSSKVPYDNAIFDQTAHVETRDREFAWLDIAANPVKPKPRAPSPVLDPGARVEKVSSGFFNIGGAAVDAAGRLYFVDARLQRIYRWSPESADLAIVRDNALDPVNLVFDKAGDLIVLSSGGKGMTVYCFRPGTPEDQMTILPPEPAADRAGLTPFLPVNYWVNGDFTNTLSTDTYEYVSIDQMFTKLVTNRNKYQYVSPDRTVFIPADEVFMQGEPYFGWKWSHVLQASSLVPAVSGHRFYVTDEAEQRTYSGTVNADGALSDLRVFTEQGGESLAQDREGNVYLAAGQIFVYNPAGKLIDTIDTPERPQDIVFGGKDHRTLFVLSHSAVYAVRTRFGGM
jgi:sugar lactone lactonase YvrE